MKLTTRQDIEAPQDVVYEKLTDFDQFERMAMRRSAEVERTDRMRERVPGMAWRLRFVFRGKPRKALIRFVSADPGSALGYEVESPSLDGTARIELVALSPRRTRMVVHIEVRPKTLAARLMIQSMRLAKGRVQKKLDGASAKLANLVEAQMKSVAAR